MAEHLAHQVIPAPYELGRFEPFRRVTFRLPDELLGSLIGLAAIDDTTLAAEINGAVGSYIQARREDPEFEAKVAAVMDLLGSDTRPTQKDD